MTMTLLSAVNDYLKNDPDSRAYAMIDGATFPNILAVLATLNAQHSCIHRGELTFEEAITAAYLVPIPPESVALKWFLDGWGSNRGVILIADCEMSILRDHLRKFLTVYDERGQPMKFRFYDPRVLRAFLKICSQQQYQLLFGPINQLMMESPSGKQLMRYYSQLDGRQNDLLTLEN